MSSRNEVDVYDLELRVVALEKIMSNGALAAIDKNQRAISEMQLSLVDLGRIITGDPSLNVRPLRQEMAELSRISSEWRRDKERLKWFFVGLGITNLGAIVAALVSIMG